MSGSGRPDPAPTKLCARCGARFGPEARFCQRDGARLIAEGPEQRDPYLGRVLLGQLRIEEVVGAGGMGRVYRARQTAVGRDVAIKILHRDQVQDQDVVRRFQREARVASLVDHPNVVRVFLLGQLQDGALYLVMEYLEGCSLGALLQDEGPLALRRALTMALQICDGVGEAHAHGVVHRDIKPENIILQRRAEGLERVKVLDFGIARLLRDEQTVLTQSGLIFGTARYISPEGAGGEPTDTRSDVYSIGVLLYQLLTGDVPFDAPTPVGLLMKHIHTPAPDIRGHPRGQRIPAPIADVVMDALHKDPEQRHHDGSELAAALRHAAARAGVELRDGGSAGAGDPRTPSPPLPLSPAGRIAALDTPGPTPVLQPARAAAAAGPDTPTRSSGGVQGAVGPGRTRLVPAVLAAFLLGAGAVVSGAWLSGGLPQGARSSEPDVAALHARARQALDGDRLDAPAGNNVADLTARLLEGHPGHEGALRLRHRAATRLAERALRAAEDGQRARAQALLRRAIAMAPDPGALRVEPETLERRLARADAARLQPELRVVPERPRARAPVTLMARLPDGYALPEGAEPRFRVLRSDRRGARALEASQGSEPRTWLASHEFRRAGRYEVRLAVGDDEPLQATVEVQRRRRQVTRKHSTTTRPARNHTVETGTREKGWPSPLLSPAVQQGETTDPPSTQKGSTPPPSDGSESGREEPEGAEQEQRERGKYSDEDLHDQGDTEASADDGEPDGSEDAEAGPPAPWTGDLL